MRRLALVGEALAALLTMALAALAVAQADEGRLRVGILVGIALGWSAIPLLTHLVSTPLRLTATTPQRRSTDSPDRTALEAPEATVTALIRLGGEPLDVARTTIILSALQGPTAVIAAGVAAADELRHLGVRIYEADAYDTAVARALHDVDTDAVIVLSGRSVPRMDACRRLAGQLGGPVAWATGTIRPFNRDGYVPDSSEATSTALSAAARPHGLVGWTPDATIIRTDVLRDHPPSAGRPWAAWLRARSNDGLVGTNADLDVATRAMPVDAAAFWPDVVARQWGEVADLAGATASGPFRARVAAIGLLARALFAYPLLVWSAAPLLVGSSGQFPFRANPLLCVVAALALAALRWATVRIVSGLALTPVTDAVSALHHVPGSLIAAGALVTRRMPRSRFRLPSRPLVWAAMLLTVATGYRLLDSAGPTTTNFTIASALAMLALLWAFSMTALMQRNWERSTYRIPLDLTMSVGGVGLRAVNGSPTGLAVTGAFDNPQLTPQLTPQFTIGNHVPIAVRFDDGSSMRASAEVSGRRTIGDTEVLGLSLDHLGDHARRNWSAQLARSAQGTPKRRSSDAVRKAAVIVVDSEPTGMRQRVAILLDRLVIALAALASLAVIALLVLVMFGVRPLVIRSASMVPNLDIGDIILSEQVTASQLRPGDIATVPTSKADGGGTLTHRVVEVTPGSDGLRILTQGDANESGETTTMAPDELAGRVAFTIPGIGSPAAKIRTSAAQTALAIAALALVVGAIFRPRKREDHGRQARAT